MPTNKINSHCCRWRVCRVNCQLYEQRDLKHSSVLSSEYEEEIKRKEHTSSSNGAIHDTNIQKTLTRHLPALHYNCVLTPADITDVYKQHTTVCPPLPAAAIRHVLCGNSTIYFIYTSPASSATNLSWTLTYKKKDRWPIRLFPTISARGPLLSLKNYPETLNPSSSKCSVRMLDIQNQNFISQTC
jgi:hypothetical protein